MTLDHEAMFNAAKRAAFIYDHHHLISPWLFSPQEIARRNFILLNTPPREDAKPRLLV